MDKHTADKLGTIKFGLVFALLAILYGYGMGAVFGIAEDDIKSYLKAQGKSSLNAKYKGDEKKMDKVVKKSWKYIKRGHMHGGGIGAGAIGLILILVFLTSIPSIYRSITSLIIGIGALGYPISWTLAGLYAPALGGTTAGKESIAWLGFSSASFCIAGVLLVFIFVIYHCFIAKKTPKNSI